MTDPNEPTQEQTSEQRTVRVRRAPRYGVFMALGAVTLALAGGIVASMVEPGLQPDGSMIDTSPVIGFTIVIGFVVGAGLGALIAVILDATVGRKSESAEAERTSVTVRYDEADRETPSAEADVDSPPGPETKS
ncbi:hypothetical protein [uncultured Agrococcus sp.]|uniref:hypothetical protein n=1 Tax=uncultured Agrococcus sp. TaxID=382258 RepID=UPI0025CFFAD8|nr:hypothetical protein [uncultured Agrococcus sp.]